MSKLGLPVTIEPDSQAWHFAWAALARDIPAGDTTGFALEHARTFSMETASGSSA